MLAIGERHHDLTVQRKKLKPRDHKDVFKARWRVNGTEMRPTTSKFSSITWAHESALPLWGVAGHPQSFNLSKFPIAIISLAADKTRQCPKSSLSQAFSFQLSRKHSEYDFYPTLQLTSEFQTSCNVHHHVSLSWFFVTPCIWLFLLNIPPETPILSLGCSFHLEGSRQS